MQHGVWFQLSDNALYSLAVANIGPLKTHLRLPAHPIEIFMRALPRQIVSKVTDQPRAWKCHAAFTPMKPAPPVIRIDLMFAP